MKIAAWAQNSWSYFIAMRDFKAFIYSANRFFPSLLTLLDAFLRVCYQVEQSSPLLECLGKKSTLCSPTVVVTALRWLCYVGDWGLSLSDVGIVWQTSQQR